MEELNQILEKISTLNINANTNIDIQAIVEKYVMWSTIKGVATTFLVCFLGVIVMVAIYKLVNKTIKEASNQAKTEEVEKFLKELENWNSVDGINKRLTEILEYMPRNKKKRKLDE